MRRIKRVVCWIKGHNFGIPISCIDNTTVSGGKVTAICARCLALKLVDNPVQFNSAPRGEVNER